MTAPERINMLKLIEKQLPEGTNALDGTAVRFCFVSACDGMEYAPMNAVEHDMELLKAQHAQAFSAGYEAGEKDHQAPLARIAELEGALGVVAGFSDAWPDSGEGVKIDEFFTWRELARAVLAKGDG